MNQYLYLQNPNFTAESINNDGENSTILYFYNDNDIVKNKVIFNNAVFIESISYIYYRNNKVKIESIAGFDGSFTKKKYDKNGQIKYIYKKTTDGSVVEKFFKSSKKMFNFK